MDMRRGGKRNSSRRKKRGRILLFRSFFPFSQTPHGREISQRFDWVPKTKRHALDERPKITPETRGFGRNIDGQANLPWEPYDLTKSIWEKSRLKWDRSKGGHILFFCITLLAIPALLSSARRRRDPLLPTVSLVTPIAEHWSVGRSLDENEAE